MSVRKAIGWAALLAVAGALIAGFAAFGSPQHGRLVALDRQRTDDLDLIKTAVYQREGPNQTVPLPAQLPKDIVGSHADGSSATVDPETHIPYRYERIDGKRYRLCATFALASDPRSLGPKERAHAAGPVCAIIDVSDSSN